MNVSKTVNVDVRESETARMTEGEFRAMIGEGPPAPAATPVQAQQTEARQSFWRYGLMLMLAALVVESFVGRG